MIMIIQVKFFDLYYLIAESAEKKKKNRIPK